MALALRPSPLISTPSISCSQGFLQLALCSHEGNYTCPLRAVLCAPGKKGSMSLHVSFGESDTISTFSRLSFCLYTWNYLFQFDLISPTCKKLEIRTCLVEGLFFSQLSHDRLFSDPMLYIWKFSVHIC